MLEVKDLFTQGRRLEYKVFSHHGELAKENQNHPWTRAGWEVGIRSD